MYHRFPSAGHKDPGGMPIEDLRRQLMYVKQHFEPVRVSQLFGDDGLREFSQPPVAITIDDGHVRRIEVRCREPSV